MWVPAKSDCKSSPLRLELAPKQMTLTNGKDQVSHGNVGMSYSYFGNSYQGITFAAMPDWDKSQPYVVLLNADEKKGRAKISFNDAGLKKRFPLENVAAQAVRLGSGARREVTPGRRPSSAPRAASSAPGCGRVTVSRSIVR